MAFSGLVVISFKISIFVLANTTTEHRKQTMTRCD